MRQQRQRHRLTQTDLAQLAGCTVSMIKKIEANVRQPSMPLLERLVSALTRTHEERESFRQLLHESTTQPSAQKSVTPTDATSAGSAGLPDFYRRLPEGIVTFLLADISNSLSLWEQKPQQMNDTMQRYRRLVRQIIETHDGIIFRTISDVIYSVFTTADQAVSAAQQVQLALSMATWDATGQLQGRLVLHTGMAPLYEGDYCGPTLCRAMRLLHSGNSSQVLVTQATRTVLRDQDSPTIMLQDLGCHPLSNSNGQEHLFRLLTPGLTPVATPNDQVAVQLTRREKEVVQLVAEGLSNRQIAKQLYLSPHTVNAHLQAIFRKLEISSRTALIRFALNQGLSRESS